MMLCAANCFKYNGLRVPQVWEISRCSLIIWHLFKCFLPWTIPSLVLREKRQDRGISSSPAILARPSEAVHLKGAWCCL